MKRLDRALLRLAEHGAPRGADALIRGVEAELGDNVVVGLPQRSTPPPRPRLRARWVIAAVLGTLLIVGGPTLLLTLDRDPEVTPVVTTIPSPTTTFLDTTPSTIGIPTTTTSTTVPETTTTVPPRPLALDIAWERIEAPDLQNAWMSGVAAWEGGYVAVGGAVSGHDAAVWLSPDGRSWEKVDSPTFGSDQEWLGGDGDQFMNGVAVLDGVIVAVGADEVASEHRQIAAAWYSADGRTWTRVPHDPSVFGTSVSYFDSVVTWNGRFVAAGIFNDTTGVWVSTDGIAWTRSEDPDLAVFEAVDLETKPVRVVGSRLFLVMGTTDDSDRAQILTSQDGIEWIAVAGPPDDGNVFDIVGTPSGDVIGFGGSTGTGWWARAWRLLDDGSWDPVTGGWAEHGSDIVIATESSTARTLVSWAGSDVMWGSTDGRHWYQVGEFQSNAMEIMDVAGSPRVWGSVIDILDEGSVILAAGSANAWSSTDDIGGRCYVDPGDGSRGSCRSDAAIWIGVPTG